MLILCTMCLMSVSCKCHEVVSSSEVQDVQKFRSVDTILIRDTVFRHDSIIYRERTIHDTVFVTKEVYRNQRLSTFDLQHSTKADTIVVTEYRDKIIEHPPERYVPKFYRWCTVVLWVIIILVVGCWAMRRWLKR